ncbi:MAG TPA: pyridoxamine 5'-phosphate oxidase family protein [Deltaproteobacteria bacterium]|nr:pyridoxamine 5'-phosphate oxidase family protein [Deltaproteobacteria bacterium]
MARIKEMLTSFDADDLKEFEPEAKVGLIATVNPEGLPHITLITALQAKTPEKLIWGQFTEGMSKKHVKSNPKTGFLIMTMDRSLWRGKALWTHEARKGEDYAMFNNKPMFRYNSYCGIHTVHYMDLVGTYGREGLPMGRIVLSLLLTKLAKSRAKGTSEGRILKPWAEGLFNRTVTIKFLSYVDTDGFPVIVPLIQCQAPDSTRLVFSPHAYRRELDNLKPGMSAAVFGLTLDMEDVLVRGVFRGFERHRAAKLGVVDLTWVYNSMPPIPGQIYPETDLKPVVNF